MTIFVFGNPDLTYDSLPIEIIPELQKKYPNYHFLIQDPNEEWEIPEKLIIIDTVMGIKKPKIFHGLEYFEKSPNVSIHDFDAYSNLLYLQKLGKLKDLMIVGLPPSISQTEAAQYVSNFLKEINLP